MLMSIQNAMKHPLTALVMLSRSTEKLLKYNFMAALLEDN